MQARQQEIFEIIRDDLQAQPFWSDFDGTFYLTGGAAQVQGVIELAASVYEHPVERAHHGSIDGDQIYASRPDLTTVLGLLEYARRCELRGNRARGWARMGQTFKNAFSSIRLF
jgi:cell division protein FtsA